MAKFMPNLHRFATIYAPIRFLQNAKCQCGRSNMAEIEMSMHIQFLYDPTLRHFTTVDIMATDKAIGSIGVLETE